MRSIAEGMDGEIDRTLSTTLFVSDELILQNSLYDNFFH